MAAVAVKEPVLAAVPVPRKRLTPNALKLVQHVRQEWFGKAAPGVTADDIRSPHYFALLSNRLGRHDLITILLDDESQEFELCVERVLRDEVHTSVRKVWQRQPLSDVSVPVGDAGEYRCERLPAMGFCIVRNSDGLPIIKGHTTARGAMDQWYREQPRPVLS